MTASKLPEWPEEPGLCGTSHDWLNYHALVSYAALARMEALVFLIQETPVGSEYQSDWIPWLKDRDELLAACLPRLPRVLFNGVPRAMGWEPSDGGAH